MKSLLSRLDALERRINPPQPDILTIIIRIFDGDGTPGEYLTVDGRTIERKAGESEESYLSRAEKLCEVRNGTRVLHENSKL